MLKVFTALPEGLLTAATTQLYGHLGGPALIHLPGRLQPALFVSVLLHGNEDTGWLALQELLQRYQGQQLPRALSLFIGNVEAARYGLRHLDHQPDYNRIWAGSDTPEAQMTAEIIAQMKSRGVFASIDIHNNTGRNPHYSCVNRLEPAFLNLASLFGRNVVYFIRPNTIQSIAFTPLCPTVILECGQPGQRAGVEHARDFVDCCLNLSSIPSQPALDIDLFHTVATIKVPPNLTFGFEDLTADLSLPPNLDQLNFLELPTGTPLAIAQPGAYLEAWDETGHAVHDQYFQRQERTICLAQPAVPSMFTLDRRVIRQDCLGYLMQRLSCRLPGFEDGGPTFVAE